MNATFFKNEFLSSIAWCLNTDVAFTTRHTREEDKVYSSVLVCLLYTFRLKQVKPLVSPHLDYLIDEVRGKEGEEGERREQRRELNGN